MKQFFSDITNFAKTRKFWAAVAGLVVNELIAFYATNPPTWLNIVVLIATAIGVYGVPNEVGAVNRKR